jgi:hypothetical protein
MLTADVFAIIRRQDKFEMSYVYDVLGGTRDQVLDILLCAAISCFNGNYWKRYVLSTKHPDAPLSQLLQAKQLAKDELQNTAITDAITDFIQSRNA